MLCLMGGELFAFKVSALLFIGNLVDIYAS